MRMQVSLGRVLAPVQTCKTNREIEISAYRSISSKLGRNVLVLGVFACEVSPHGGYLVEPYLCGVLAIRNNNAALCEVTTTGKLTQWHKLPCHGSVSREDMRKALGFDRGVRVYARELMK